MFHQSMHTYILSAALTLPKRFEWITFPFLPLITHCRKSKSSHYRLTSESKLNGQNAPPHERKLLCWPADNHSVTRSTHPSSSRRLTATRVVQRGHKAGIRRVKRKDSDLPMWTFMKNLNELKITFLLLREACSWGRTWNRRFQYFT
jgi:hypothetical protein